MRKKICVILAAAMVASALSGCASAADAATGSGQSSAADGGEVYKIAVAGPMTGDNAEYGEGFAAAAEIAAEEWNEKGGVLGRQIVVEPYDDKNAGEEAASIAQRIVSDPDVIGVIGHFASGVSMAAAPVYQDNRLIEISPSASHPDYSGMGNYIFRNNTVISSEFEVIIDMIQNDVNLEKVGIISIMTDWGTSAGQIADELISASDGLELVAHEQVMESSDDYSPAIARLRDAGSEVVICVGMYNLIAPVARQYKAVEPDIQIIGVSNAYTQQVIELGGDAVEGLLCPVSFYPESEDPNIQSFVTRYREKTGTEPSSLTAQAYDSAGMLLEALEQTGSADKEQLRDTLNSITFAGTTGETKFDENGDASKVYTKVMIQNGEFVILE